MKSALVLGAGGLIGSHLIQRLKAEGYWVRGVGRRKPPFQNTLADEYLCLDLCDRAAVDRALLGHAGQPFNEVYQLAAEMGGIGYIDSAACEIMHNSALLNLNAIDGAAKSGVTKFYLASSVCVYRDMQPGEPPLSEEAAYPANPDNQYGWEKLYSERVAQAFAESYGMDVKIGRFQTCFGPLGPWTGGREKAPCAICRKVAEAEDGGEIEVWGDGTAVRSYLYVDDMIDAIFRHMQSELEGPVNIGSAEYVSIKQLVEMVVAISGKKLGVRYVPGPVGVQSRNFSNQRIYSTGWTQKYTLRQAIEKTYPWVLEQIRQTESGPKQSLSAQNLAANA